MWSGCLGWRNGAEGASDEASAVVDPVTVAVEAAIVEAAELEDEADTEGESDSPDVTDEPEQGE